MKRVQTKHRKYQILTWIDAIQEGYPGDGTLYPPHVSNIALLMLDAGVRKERLREKFGSTAYAGRYRNDIVRYMKQYVANLLGHYDMRLFMDEQFVRSERTCWGIKQGIEERSGRKVRVYRLSGEGRRVLRKLEQDMKRKRELTPTTYERTFVDKLLIPVKKTTAWNLEELVFLTDRGLDYYYE